MKKLTKFFLLASCTWFLFLWFSFAQNLIEEDTYADELSVNADFGSNGRDNESYNPNVYSAANYHCSIPARLLIAEYSLLIIWWIFAVISLCSIILYYKFKNTRKYSRSFCVPIINIYALSKITIGRIRFYCLVLLIWFIGYLAFINKNSCYGYPDWLLFPVIIAWLFSFIILLILWDKLEEMLEKQDSDKKSQNE